MLPLHLKRWVLLLTRFPVLNGQTLGNTLFLSAEQVGFRVGILIAAIFSILGLLLVVYMRRFFKVGLKLFCLSGIGVGCISR